MIYSVVPRLTILVSKSMHNLVMRTFIARKEGEPGYEATSITLTVRERGTQMLSSVCKSRQVYM